MDLQAILSSFALVAASEMGDKTQLLAFSLAGRFRKPWAVMGGILVATVANHALASSVGVWIAEHVPRRVMAGILAATFFVFGLWTLRPRFAGRARQTVAVWALPNDGGIVLLGGNG